MTKQEASKFKERKKTVIAAIGLAAVLTGVYFISKFYKAVEPAVLPPPGDITEAGGDNLGLNLPAGFKISVFAKDLPGARVIAIDAFGNFWVSQTREGKITLLEVQNGVVRKQYPIFQNLNNPHGLAFDPENPFMLYFAEEDKISRVPVYSEGPPEKIIDLPSGGGHFTRTLGFGPDGRLYVSIGSSCNVCDEEDSRRAKIFTLNRDGSDFKEFARGLRNSVFFIWHPETKEMWATEMGRDWLGDNLPPDEINVVEEGKNYGWPICYGRKIHDSDFDKNVYVRDPCADTVSSRVDIPAHSAPLGLAFFEGDLLVAYHGSWNRSAPTGYKVIRHRFNAQGEYLGAEDFITGWLTGGGATGRPVDILVKERAIYISDDKAGVIYKATY